MSVEMSLCMSLWQYLDFGTEIEITGIELKNV